MMTLLWSLLAFAAVVSATPEFHRIRVHHKSMYADEDVLIDTDANYAMVTVGHIHGTGFQSINLHDIDMGYTAVKDVAKGKCFIQQSNHTMAELRNKVQQILQNTDREHIEEYYWTCERQSIPSGMLKALFGERIASFCENYESMFVSRTNNAHAVAKRSVHQHTAYWCVICIVQGEQQESLLKGC